MANICPQSGHTNVLIKASLQKGTTLAGSLVAKGRRIYIEQKEKRNLRGTRNAPVTFPSKLCIGFVFSFFLGYVLTIPDTRKSIRYCVNTYIRYVTLYFRDRRGAAWLRYINRAEI